MAWSAPKKRPLCFSHALKTISCCVYIAEPAARECRLLSSPFLINHRFTCQTELYSFEPDVGGCALEQSADWPQAQQS